MGLTSSSPTAWGSVIAYDCLKRVAGTKKVDMLITLGTPSGCPRSSTI